MINIFFYFCQVSEPHEAENINKTSSGIKELNTRVIKYEWLQMDEGRLQKRPTSAQSAAYLLFKEARTSISHTVETTLT